MEGFLTRGWELILPESGGTSALPRGATLAARWLREPQPISNPLLFQLGCAAFSLFMAYRPPKETRLKKTRNQWRSRSREDREAQRAKKRA